jgi:hypothetical protein
MTKVDAMKCLRAVMMLTVMSAVAAGCETPENASGERQVGATSGQSGQAGRSGGSGGTTSSSGTGGVVGTGGTAGSGAPDGGTRSDGGPAADGRMGGVGATAASAGRSGTAGRSGRGGTSGPAAGIGTGGNPGGTMAGSSGGTSGTGGSTGPCTPAWEEPPANVAAWVDESWNAQLGANVESRKAWLLDSVMKGQGQLNICVRWGASSAPSAEVKQNMGSSAERWFNDWFAKLSDYGCFPYSHIAVKVTGWAVRPGEESWVSDLDRSIKVYTEKDSGTDPPGEPMCPSACSFFANWSHTFPNCPGGEAFHHDYWIWLDDNLPGGGAAAVVSRTTTTGRAPRRAAVL